MNNDPRPQTIAIDGPAASGKSSVGEAVAARLGYTFLDTGLMYRAFTLAALRAGIPASDSDACGELARVLDLRVDSHGATTTIHLAGDDVTSELRSSAVESNVSAYSAIASVRTELVRLQREIADAGRAVLVGRDIGTVVAPDAPVKLFLTASEEARASRRSAQAIASWDSAEAARNARDDIAGRDRIDSARATSPLVPAPDAVIIDTSDLTLDEVIETAMEHVHCAGLS